MVVVTLGFRGDELSEVDIAGVKKKNRRKNVGKKRRSKKAAKVLGLGIFLCSATI